MINITIDSFIRQNWSGEAILGTFYMEGFTDVKKAAPQIDQEVSNVMSEIRRRGKSILDDPHNRMLRETFRSMPDMDPARYRPASEALVRRCLEKDLFRVSPLVDVNNLLSVKLLIPLGIYDIDCVESVTWNYRIGHETEKYSTISNQVKSASGKLVIADDKGVIGSPVADSGRAAIREETKRIMVIAYLPFRTTGGEASLILKEIGDTFALFNPTMTKQRILNRIDIDT